MKNIFVLYKFLWEFSIWQRNSRSRYLCFVVKKYFQFLVCGDRRGQSSNILLSLGQSVTNVTCAPYERYDFFMDDNRRHKK